MDSVGIDWTKVMIAMLGTGGSLAVGLQAIKEIVIARMAKKREEQNSLNELKNKIDSLDESVKNIAEGLSLCLQSDQVIFEAFRNKHINGESEVMDHRINSYLYDQVQEHLIKGE